MQREFQLENSRERKNMAQFSTEQRVFMVRKYLESRSFEAMIEAFRQHFPERNPPSKSTIFRNVEKYLRNATSLNLCKGRSGRPQTARRSPDPYPFGFLLLGIPKKQSFFNTATQSWRIEKENYSGMWRFEWFHHKLLPSNAKNSKQYVAKHEKHVEGF